MKGKSPLTYELRDSRRRSIGCRPSRSRENVPLDKLLMSIQIPLYRLDELNFWVRHAKSGSIDLSKVDLTALKLSPLKTLMQLQLEQSPAYPIPTTPLRQPAALSTICQGRLPLLAEKYSQDVITKHEKDQDGNNDEVLYENHTVKNEVEMTVSPAAEEITNIGLAGEVYEINKEIAELSSIEDGVSSNAFKSRILFEDDAPHSPREDTYEEQHHVQDNSTCCVCHSADRSLDVLGEYSDIFKRICGDIYSVNADMLLLCWECRALLKNARRFQKRVHLTQQILNDEMLRQCLSTITITSLPTVACYQFEEQETRKAADIRDIHLEQNPKETFIIEVDTLTQRTEHLIELDSCHSFDDDDDRVDRIQQKTFENKKVYVNVLEKKGFEINRSPDKRTEDELDDSHGNDNDDRFDELKAKQTSMTIKKNSKKYDDVTVGDERTDQRVAVENDSEICQLAGKLAKQPELTIKKNINKNSIDEAMTGVDETNQPFAVVNDAETNHLAVKLAKQSELTINKNKPKNRDDNRNELIEWDDEPDQPAAAGIDICSIDKLAKPVELTIKKIINKNTREVMKRDCKINQPPAGDDNDRIDKVVAKLAKKSEVMVKKKKDEINVDKVMKGVDETNQPEPAAVVNDDNKIDNLVQSATNQSELTIKNGKNKNNVKEMIKGDDKKNKSAAAAGDNDNQAKQAKQSKFTKTKKKDKVIKDNNKTKQSADAGYGDDSTELEVKLGKQSVLSMKEIKKKNKDYKVINGTNQTIATGGDDKTNILKEKLARQSGPKMTIYKKININEVIKVDSKINALAAKRTENKTDDCHTFDDDDDDRINHLATKRQKTTVNNENDKNDTQMANGDANNPATKRTEDECHDRPISVIDVSINRVQSKTTMQLEVSKNKIGITTDNGEINQSAAKRLFCDIVPSGTTENVSERQELYDKSCISQLKQPNMTMKNKEPKNNVHETTIRDDESNSAKRPKSSTNNLTNETSVKNLIWPEHKIRASNKSKYSKYKELQEKQNDISKYCLIKTVNSNHPVTEYQCSVCEKRLSTMELLKKHYSELHDKFTCDYCGANFPFKIQVEVHIERKHFAVCDICHRTFKKLQIMKSHRKMKHTISKKEDCYCVQCDKYYANAKKLERHVYNSVKHMKEWKRPVKPKRKKEHKCAEPGCSRVFLTDLGLKQHFDYEHKHISYQCEHCGKTSRTKGQNETHVKKSHKGYKPPKNYFCEICGDGFAAQLTLENHMMRHSGLRPHACPLCDKRFTQRVAMQRHVRNVHEGIPQRNYKKKHNDLPSDSE